MEFGDFVTLKSRVDYEVAITCDSRERYIAPGRKGLTLPRMIAELGIKQHAFQWDSQNGAVKESLLYIEEDVDTPLELPHKKLDMEEVNKIKKTDGLGKKTAFVDGKFVPMKTVEIEPSKENFAVNNV